MSPDALAADAVLFDLDGVLIDSRSAFAASVNAALVSAGRPSRPEAELHQFIGPPLHRTFEQLLDVPAGSAEADRCVEAYRARYRRRAGAETLVFDGIPELVQSLSRTVPLVVATSKPGPLAELVLGELGLAQHFAAVVGPSLDAIAEPKSETLERALAALHRHVAGSGGSSAQRPVMVGDRYFDVEAARAHGLPCVGVLWGIGSEEELLAAGAARLARDPGELAEIIGAVPA